MAKMRQPVVHFSLIGGAHQFLHSVPVAAQLAQDGDVSITLFTGSAADSAAVAALLRDLGAPAIPIVTMALPAVGTTRPLKALRLLWWARTMLRCDILVTAERTTTLLQRVPLRQPLYVHIPHGAGDGAKGFEPRLRRFDHIIVAGEKDARRMLGDHLATPDGLHVSGYIKLAALRRLRGGERLRLFANDRPTILYNPHFQADLSSWPRDGLAVIEAILSDGRYNLVAAPHMRMFQGASAADKAPWLDFADPDRCIVDLDSPALTDMRYTEGADIYLGDVSSQIYEFLSRPRPCLFLNSHGVDWQADPNYRMWHFGPVLSGVDRAPGAFADAITDAVATHAHYAAHQHAAVTDALGPLDSQSGGDDAIARAAALIMGLIPPI